MKVAIVGVGGVGAAHLVAASRIGAEVVAVIDTDQDTLDRFSHKWENRWESVVETGVPQAGTRYLKVFPERLDVDITILATPPHTHAALLAQALEATKARDGHVIVEKPLTITTLDWSTIDRASMCAEWIHHPELSIKDGTTSIGMCFKEAHTTDWGYKLSLEEDFLPHLLSILHASGRRAEDIQVQVSTNDLLRVIFTDESGERMLCWGRRKGGSGLFVGAQCLDWHPDLFDRQLLLGRGIPILDAWKWERLIEADREVEK